MGGGDGGGDSETTTKVELSPQQRRVLNAAFPIFDRYLKEQKAPPPGTGHVGVNATQQQAWRDQLAASSRMQAMLPGMTQAWQSQLGATDVMRNPYLQRAMAGAVRPVMSQLGDQQRQGFDRISRDLMPAAQDFERQRMNQVTQDLIPSLRTGSVPGGGYGSAKYGAIIGQQMNNMQRDIDTNRRNLNNEISGIGSDLRTGYREAGQAASDATARMGSDAYGQGLTAAGRALSMSPTVMSQMGVPGQLRAQVGAQQQMADQAAEDAMRSDWYQRYLMPLNLTQQIVNSTMGIPSGTTVSGAAGGGRPGWQGAVGGAASGATMGAAVGGPWGAAVGGGLGLLAGLWM